MFARAKGSMEDTGNAIEGVLSNGAFAMEAFSRLLGAQTECQRESGNVV